MSLRFSHPAHGCVGPVILITLIGMSALAAGAHGSPVTIDVHLDEKEQPVWPEVLGINLNPHVGAAAIENPEAIEAVRRAGIKSVRFPNGCVADLYDWKKPSDKRHITVDEFLAFCDAIDAEPYYTLNLQGGTEDITTTAPADTDLAKRTRYRHTAPNPCGYTNYHFGTLAEALELVQRYTIRRTLEGKRPILCYEMGNENWGQSRSDWPPELYAATVRAYSRAIRDAVDKARREHNLGDDFRVHITAVGFPLVGNNQLPAETPDYDVNSRWTREMNALHADGSIDAVQDHFYPGGGQGMDLLVWPYHNLENMFHARRGLANPHLGGYLDEALAFRMPIEVTEWNVKCWGEKPQEKSGAENLEFEEGLAGWTVEAEGGEAVTRADAGRRGQGVRLAVPSDGRSVTLYQVVDLSKQQAKLAEFRAWVRTDHPERLALQLVKVDAEGGLGDPLAERAVHRPYRAGHWLKIGVGGRLPEDTSRVAAVITLTGPGTSADVDAVEVFHWKMAGTLASAAVDTPAQQLAVADMMRVMIEHGVRRSHLHHLFGGYPCGIMQPDGRTKPGYEVFRFYAGWLGTHTVSATVHSPTFDYDSPADGIATDFNAVTPDVTDVPLVSALAMRDRDHAYVLAFNRSLDETLEASIRLHGVDGVAEGRLRRLTCKDIDLAGVRVEEGSLPSGKQTVLSLNPHTMHLLRMKFGRGEAAE